MPNLTPPRYRTLYQIYPGKAGLHETADITRTKIEAQIQALGRTVGRGAGTSVWASASGPKNPGLREAKKSYPGLPRLWHRKGDSFEDPHRG